MVRSFQGQPDCGQDGPFFQTTKLACPVPVEHQGRTPAKRTCGIVPYPLSLHIGAITTEPESMKNDRIRTLIERVAGKTGVPDDLTREIVPLAQRHLKAAGRGQRPQHRDVVWAVNRAQREWSRRFLSALEARSTSADAASSPA